MSTGQDSNQDGATTQASNHSEDVEQGSFQGSETTGTGSTPSQGQPVPKSDPAIAKQETKHVFRLRLLVITVLLASTIGVAMGVHGYVSNAEERTFENQFEDDSVKVLEAIGSALDLTLGSVDAFLVGLVSYARDKGDKWPQVTYPDYAVRVAKLRSLSKAVLVTQYHYVTGEGRADWESYSVLNDAWVQEGIDVQATDHSFHGKIVDSYWTRGDIHDDGNPYHEPGPYLPKWQQSPVIPIYAPYNWDAMSHPSMRDAVDVVRDDRLIAISDVSNLPRDDSQAAQDLVDGNNHFIKDYIGDGEDETEPFSDLYFPILDYAADYVDIPDDNTTLGNFVGVFAMTFYWRDLIKDILPTDSNGIVVVIQNACDQAFTYQVNGPDTIFLGAGDLHETKYNYLSKHSPLVNLEAFSQRDRSYKGLPLSDKGCTYYLSVYPSSQMEDDYLSKDPVVFTLVAVAIFAFTSLLFMCYDYMVERRQEKVMNTAVKTSAIVSSLFPANVRDRLFRSENTESNHRSSDAATKNRLMTFLSDGKQETGKSTEFAPDTTPIADLFPHCTVLFSDISGFTAWSSVREPTQVFRLLESLYHGFDVIARRRHVFKVETIGDAYVAVVGLPEPCKDHAVVMTKFARDCLLKMAEVVRDLETTLGPGTGDLKLRVGLHSGAVTAGVLRGEKGRFQLFGDTVNTASRMESTGAPNKIQASATTAEQLIKSSKGSWVKPRADQVEAKGKGTLQTFWIEPSLMGPSHVVNNDETETSESSTDGRTKRLVDWNAEVLSRLVKQILAKRKVKPSPRRGHHATTMNLASNDKTILEEVKDVIEFPEYDIAVYEELQEATSVHLDETVEMQLRDYVVAISELYEPNSFHCFHHASHVAMSTAKLLSRIVRPDDVLSDRELSDEEDVGKALHNKTFGISSDPLAQFACVFSALIHDVGHPGVPNSTLVREESPMAIRFKDRSVAEQNSVDIAWQLLLTEPFKALRETICDSPEELRRLRQLVVNAVMATDVLDQELVDIRNERWNRAFEGHIEESTRSQQNRRATLVIEYLLQASDVAHTMQHWHIYQKWNERLLEELVTAHKMGRLESNPLDFWYEGELKFFDNYVLGVATKMNRCGVFGETSDEYFTYADKNREEWARRGKDVLAEASERF